MTRANDVTSININATVKSGSGTTTSYFVISDVRPALFMGATVTGINPAAQNSDTLNSTWAFSVNGGTAYTTLATMSADEYNDTDDTNSLGTIGSDAVTFDISTTAQKGVRVAAGAIIRHLEAWTGTVTDGQALFSAEFIVI